MGHQNVKVLRWTVMINIWPGSLVLTAVYLIACSEWPQSNYKGPKPKSNRLESLAFIEKKMATVDQEQHQTHVTLPEAPVTPVVPPTAQLPVSTARGPVLGRWRKDDIVKSGCLVLRGLALIFSLISLIIMACNKHGEGRNFDEYEEFRYVLAIAIVATLYTGAQCLRHVHEFSTRTAVLSRKKLALIGFCGDQVMAYLLISSASSAIPMIDRMREWTDNLFTDSLVSAVAMSLLAFFALAVSSLISGYKLATRYYV